MNKYYHLYLLLCICSLLVCSCNDNYDVASTNYRDDNESPHFQIIGKFGLYSPFMEDDLTIHMFIPQKEDFSNLKMRFNYPDSIFTNGEYIKKEIPVDLSDFNNNLHITIGSNNNLKTKSLIVYDLPVLIINTPDSLPIESKEYRKDGCLMRLLDEDGNIEDLGTAGIKGRGNSTWIQAKKPYNVKLDKKKSLLGMNKSKHWVLLSHPYYDRTQLHNDVAFEIARLTDYPWVQSGEFVELIMNGKHQSIYYLCEKIRIEKDKIDISEISASDTIGDALTGGYILESDIVAKDSNYVLTNYYNETGNDIRYPIIWNFTKPEGIIPQVQISFIENALNHLESLLVEDSVLLSGEYRRYLDIETAINWWLVENLCLNEESSRTKNLILYKDRDSVGGGKFMVGPPWDFDAWTFGQTGYEKLYALENTWIFGRLFKDPFFVNRVKQKWNNYKTEWEEKIPQYIEDKFNMIHRSAKRNEMMWTHWNKRNYFPEKSYEQIVEDMKEAFIKQLNWMDSYIKAL